MTAKLRTSSYEPSNWVDSVAWMNSVVCSCGEFQPGIVCNCHSNSAISFVNFCNFMNKANSHTPPKWKYMYMQDQNVPFWPLCCKSKAILFKKFRPGRQIEVFIWENFYPGY